MLIRIIKCILFHTEKDMDLFGGACGKCGSTDGERIIVSIVFGLIVLVILYIAI